MEIRLYAGQIGSGKGYITSQHTKKLKEVGKRILNLSFADPIKRFVDSMFGFDKNLKPVTKILTEGAFDSEIETTIYNFVRGASGVGRDIKVSEETQDDYDRVVKLVRNSWEFDISDEHKIKSIRKAYQLVGTNIAQPHRMTIWAEYMIDIIGRFKDTPIDYIIIDDFRFLMEIFVIMTKLGFDVDIIPYVIIADERVRAKRRECTIEELHVMEEHLSEKEFKLIHEWVKMRFPNNIINNN